MGYYDEAGNPLYMVGVVFDVTERKEAQQERLELSGRLISAQERERHRIAQELHDDFCQRLALLAIDLETVTELFGESPERARERLHELWNVTGEIGADIHSLSHRLHSSTLESLGLPVNVDSLCKEFAKQHSIQIDFRHQGLPPEMSSDIVLSVFRIVQEGLRNVRKHSHASKVAVRLKGNGEAISLTLSDNGVGFDLSKDLKNGIGIQSMKERVRMLDGTFKIRSGPTGTRIWVIVPLKRPKAA